MGEGGGASIRQGAFIREGRLIQIIWIRSDEGLTLETSAFRISVRCQFTLSTPLIKPNFCIIQIIIHH